MNPLSDRAREIVLQVKDVFDKQGPEAAKEAAERFHLKDAINAAHTLHKSGEQERIDKLYGEFISKHLANKLKFSVLTKVACNAPISPQSTMRNESLDKMIIDGLAKTHPFVFSGNKETTTEPPDMTRSGLPFEHCSFEQSGDTPLTVQEDGTHIWCVATSEIDPETFTYAALLSYMADRNSVAIEAVSGIARYDNDLDIMACLVRVFVQKLHHKELATENVRDSVKSKRHGRIKIKPIIHVMPKRIESAHGVYGGPLDWKHRWEVRGHWRRCDTLGKDRSGAYTVNGFTWVVPHEKGNGPLVKKTRVIHAE